MPLTYRSIRMDNNDIPLRSGQGEKYSFVNLKFHVDRYRGIDVAQTLVVNKLNQDINQDNFLSQMTVLQPSLLFTTAR